MAYFMLQTPEDQANGNPGKRYQVPTTLTIGEQRDVFREFGAEAAAIGVVWIAVRREFPGTSVADVENCTAEIFEEEEDKLPPTNVGGTVSAGENGKPTEQLDIGSRGSESTTA